MDTQYSVVIALVAVILLALVLLLWRSFGKQSDALPDSQKYLDEKLDRLERALRLEVTEASRCAPRTDAKLGDVSTKPNPATQCDAKVSG